MRPRDLAPDALFLAVAVLSVLADGARPVEVGLLAVIVVALVLGATRQVPFHAPLAALYGLYGVYWLAVSLHRFRVGGVLVLALAAYHAVAATRPEVGLPAGE